MVIRDVCLKHEARITSPFARVGRICERHHRMAERSVLAAKQRLGH